MHGNGTSVYGANVGVSNRVFVDPAAGKTYIKSILELTYGINVMMYYLRFLFEMAVIGNETWV